MKKIIFIGFSILLLFTIWHYVRNPLTTKITIRGKTFYVDVAVTSQEKERGLGYRKSLDPDHGILFVYDHPQRYQFWMKGMQFPLDFIWIRDKTIVDVRQNVSPPNGNEQPQVVIPKTSVDKILEVSAGTVQQYDIVVEDSVTFQTN